ncbi:hypothetical protein [Streptomyces brevispora]|uniref:hypothetical protein n=1 Tax=Streptomyces brevispora TaxID=887462 RepID=UPI0038002833
MAHLELEAQVVLAGLLVGEDAAAADRVQCVELAVEFMAAGGYPGVTDLDVCPYSRLGNEEFKGLGGCVRPRIFSRHGVLGLFKRQGF